MYMRLCFCLGSLGCGPWYVDQGHKAACLVGFLSLCFLECRLNSQDCLFVWLLSPRSLVYRPSIQGCLLTCFLSLGCIPWCIDQVHKAVCLLGFLRLCSLVSGILTQGCLFSWVPYIEFLGVWTK
jgi:hypothetical protein